MSKLSEVTASREWALTSVIAILLLAFLLRVPTLDQSSLWLDEVFSYRRASQTSWEETLSMLVNSGHAPLFDGVLLSSWLELGQSEFFLRFLPMWLGMLSITGIYTLGHALFNRTVGLLSALFTSLSPLHIIYSQELRMYTLAFMLATFGTYFFFKAALSHSSATKRCWAAYIICATLGLYTHYITGFLFFALFISSFIRALLQRDLRSLGNLVLSHFLIALLFAPWLPTVRLQLLDPRLAWVPEISTERLLEQFSPLFLHRTFLQPFFVPLSGLMAIILAIGLVTRPTKLKRSDSPDGLQTHLFTIASAIIPVGILIVISIFKPMLVDRYLLGIAPGLFILLTLGILFLLKRYLTTLIPLAFVVGLMISAWGVTTTDLKEDWRSAASYISAQSTPDDVIIILPYYARHPMTLYYDVQLTHYNAPLRLDEESAQELLDDLQAFQRTWVVTRGFQREQAILEYIESEYNGQSISCERIGDFAPIIVCLFTNNK